MANDRKMRLGTFLSAGGEHVAAWRHPDAANLDRASFPQYLEAARIVEEALFDLILIGDAAPSSDAPIESLMRDTTSERLDPLPLISALAVTTRHIGLIATGSTSFDQPYSLARRIASVDHLSNGRAGWNCVTTSIVSTALNYNRDKHFSPAERYARAEEFVDVVAGLWDSWDDDAFVRDKESGIYFQPGGMHVLGHKGEHFSVRGPLDVRRSAQGRPVIVQAGSSEPGRQLAARVADVVFTTHQSLSSARDFYEDIKARAVKMGRSPQSILILVALMPVVGATEQEAQAKLDQLDSLIPPEIAIARLSSKLGGIDLSPYAPDAPMPMDLPEGDGMQSRRAPFLDLARREGLTLLQLAARTAGNRGHWTVAGTAQQIADRMQEWFFEGGADGFLLVPPRTPESLHEFAMSVVPELQRRGLFRTEYEGSTLRENLGLPRPARGAGFR